MSRVGKMPVVLPSGVTASVQARTVTVKGPKGQLVHEVPEVLAVKLAGSQLEVSVAVLGDKSDALHGTHRSLIEATNFIEAIEERQGTKIACLEEIAWENGWIGAQEVEAAAASMGKSNYAEYLRSLLRTRVR